MDVRAWSPEESDDTWYPFPVSSYIQSRRHLAAPPLLSAASVPGVRPRSRRASHTPAHVVATGGGGAALSLPGLGMGLSGGDPPSFGSMDATCSLLSGETEAYFDDWEDKIQAWWAVTPFRDGATACFGALGVHLMQRLEMMVRLWQAARGLPAMKPPHAVQGLARRPCHTHAPRPPPLAILPPSHFDHDRNLLGGWVSRGGEGKWREALL